MDRTAVLRTSAEAAARDYLSAQAAGAHLDPKQFAEVYKAGLCPVTVVKDPTMEALGQLLANNGGVGAVMSAEADIFRTIAIRNEPSRRT